ncbi:hypothetical protein KDW_53390 [Dictyobacter vulcani]|uniref:Response regulatory domain-containing protein n=1 Tax=Dictyobacter vulcani TaxID=2607529 RepID=A0A5J4KXB7_9CHLR|nr:response regulator [Dictyobacter vulcani]GER91177.1 hypothetical protein KDW_53390 [Dictyobacter vulcani]
MRTDEESVRMQLQQNAIEPQMVPQIDTYILVVDDDDNLCQAIQVVLEEEGFVVETALDGKEALEQVARQRPAMIVLDIGLPLLDGETVARELRARYGMTIPVMLMTVDAHVKEKAHRLKAVMGIGKPFEIEAFLTAVRQTLSSRRGKASMPSS